MKNFFKPEDFLIVMHAFKSGDTPKAVIREEFCADQANTKLNALVETWPIVKGYTDIWSINPSWPEKLDTHRARLAFIEQIPKKPCRHEPDLYKRMAVFEYVITCIHCGAELKASWDAK